ncbi:glycoside hydrolase family 92 protein [Oleiharenicola lentus]|uniref:Glycoside hydrolase family 92 protein n=1 Tax=Oleiharenicola lentus TaxID=2508720 RepID=A0A4Q1CAH8_9BACT|nr:GH92 family glycosyl hydrolase [Oleiharenicola lentus]RXK55948.1 glycoside hydrolase family 92 protein [Oleiharenicola lentus]
MKLKLFLSVLALASTALAQVEYVDPTIGNVGILLVPTRPTAHLPNSMIRVHPLRDDFLDDQINGFPLTMISHRLGEIFTLQATTGAIDAKSWTTPITYDHEKPTPYHYSVWLEEPALKLEFAPGERTGLFRFTARDRAPVVLLATRKEGEMAVAGPQSVTGIERFHGMQAYLYGEFDQPMTVTASSVKENTGRLAASPVAATARAVQFRYAISFISHEQARKNLAREMKTWDLDAVARTARTRWNDTLGKIQVTGGTDAQKRTFYTALYRSHERMINISEDGRYYSAYDHQVHDDTRPFYVDNWIWDTYLALEPLHAILNPKMQADKIASYVRMYQQSGWMPSFAVLYGDHPCMTGNHASAWIADSWAKGIRDYDVQAAYEGLRKNALEGTLLPWRNGPRSSLDVFHAENGFMPAIRPDETETVPEVHSFERRQSVSVTLEHAFADWCLAQLARAIGKKDDADLLTQRGSWWKNVFRADHGFMWPKDAKGDWIEPFDPKFSGGQGGRLFFTENNAYTYNWLPRHDFEGLVASMGGVKAAEAKLDNTFRDSLGRSKFEYFATFPDSTGLVGQFTMANEPSFHIPYLYNYLGSPWKTQKRIRQLLEAFYPDQIHGIPGDEDGGGMSAFVVMSMMGFYPVTSGVPVYVLGSPVFDRVDIKLPDGKTFTLTARNTSRDHKYIDSVKLNNQARTKIWFTHDELTQGGRLDLEMSTKPNQVLGTRDADLPPSRLTLDPVSIK